MKSNGSTTPECIRLVLFYSFIAWYNCTRVHLVTENVLRTTYQQTQLFYYHWFVQYTRLSVHHLEAEVLANGIHGRVDTLVIFMESKTIIVEFMKRRIKRQDDEESQCPKAAVDNLSA